MTNENYQAPAEIARWQSIALGIGGILSLVILGAALFFPAYREQALRSWLLGFILWGGIAIGSIGILFLQYLTGGAWGVVIRRSAEAASRTMLIIPILFIPIALGITSLYEWSHPGNDPVLQWKQPYLNPTFWIIRAVIYFVVLGIMAYLLDMWSAKQDKAATNEESAEYLGKATAFSGPAMVFYVILITFASVDWVMSLDPHWFSTIWGLVYAAGWALSSLCFLVAILAWLSGTAPMNRVLGKRHFHDIGKLILALVMIWAYFNFSQYLIIWSGNIPEETVWYLLRQSSIWGAIGVILIIIHFAFPFLILLSRRIKREPKWLAILALIILFARLVDAYFAIGPSARVSTHGVGLPFLESFSWMDIVAPLAVGGIWLGFFFFQLQKRPLVPINDPFLENAIEHGRGH